jgi:hypothetical protein
MCFQIALQRRVNARRSIPGLGSWVEDRNDCGSLPALEFDITLRLWTHQNFNTTPSSYAFEDQSPESKANDVAPGLFDAMLCRPGYQVKRNAMHLTEG